MRIKKDMCLCDGKSIKLEQPMDRSHFTASEQSLVKMLRYNQHQLHLEYPLKIRSHDCVSSASSEARNLSYTLIITYSAFYYTAANVVFLPDI